MLIMKNTEELRQSLALVFNKLMDDDLDVQQAKAIVATSNSILKSAQLEMEYSKKTGSDKEIKFLKTE